LLQDTSKINIIRCFIYQESGHVHNKCPSKTKEEELAKRNNVKIKLERSDHSIKSKEHPTTRANNFYDKRSAMTTVYFEEREHLNQHTHIFTTGKADHSKKCSNQF
jgi:hypothetical protein